MADHWKTERQDGVTFVTFDRSDKEMNVLSSSVCRELAQVVGELSQDVGLKGVVFLSGKKDFVVGADITEIAAFKTADDATDGARQLQALFQQIAELKVPTVAAIHGQCLGGGLELALACTWRVATDDPKTKLGLPEIQLGLIPGAGGTQRLPKLVGIQTALDMILTGKRLNGKKAKKINLVDALVPAHLLREQAFEHATKRRHVSRGLPELPSKLGKDLPKWATDGNSIGRKIMQKKAREMIDEKSKGFYPAPYKALEAVFEGYDLPIKKGLDLEANLFGQLALTRESNSFVHLFHATNSLKKHPYKGADKERFGTTDVDLVGIIGSGFMGAGIATVLADRTIRSRLSDPNKESIGRAMKYARTYFQKKVDRRRMKRFELSQKMAHISPATSPAGFKNVDIVIEAVFEDLNLKQKLLRDVESKAGDDFIFASNTSAIPISRIAEAAKKPERVIGMHFFSPVEKMPLLEVVVTPKTADWVAARTVSLGQEMGKQVIVVKDGPGFYTTRALSFLLNEASTILSEGNPIDHIDKAMTDFGFPVGPITLIDEVGIDVGMHVLDTIEKAFPDRMNSPKGLVPVAESGRLGRKNNKGFYLYEDGKKTRPDTGVYNLLGLDVSNKLPADEIVDRCVLVFVNESVRCLEEGILANPYDGDIGAVFGLGFPPFWGGPFKYIDHLGPKTIVDRLTELAGKHGARFSPSALLKDHAKANKLFFPEEG